MSLDEEHLVFDTYDLVTHFRYIWPSECDLMAQLAGFELESRFEDWKGTPFTADSESHVSVWHMR